VRLFGKMPAHGDFVSRGYSLEERLRLDQWLSREMDQARAQSGPGFEERYDQAPCWCFAAVGSDGLWQGGTLCPSIDSAGRRFPLLVACCGVAASEVESAAEYCVDAVFRAFEDRLSADGLCEAISCAELLPGGETAEQGWWTAGDDRSPSRTMCGEYPDGLISTMLEGVGL
jgi:type VI secretion system protein ImpM